MTEPTPIFDSLVRDLPITEACALVLEQSIRAEAQTGFDVLMQWLADDAALRDVERIWDAGDDE